MSPQTSTANSLAVRQALLKRRTEYLSLGFSEQDLPAEMVRCCRCCRVHLPVRRFCLSPSQSLSQAACLPVNLAALAPPVWTWSPCRI